MYPKFIPPKGVSIGHLSTDFWLVSVESCPVDSPHSGQSQAKVEILPSEKVPRQKTRNTRQTLEGNTFGVQDLSPTDVQDIEEMWYRFHKPRASAELNATSYSTSPLMMGTWLISSLLRS